MKKIYIAIISLLLSDVGLQAQEQDTVRLTLKEAINLAQMQSVDAAVALNELKTAYWEYRTHVADQLPEINFKGTLPAYSKQYTGKNKDQFVSVQHSLSSGFPVIILLLPGLSG